MAPVNKRGSNVSIKDVENNFNLLNVDHDVDEELRIDLTRKEMTPENIMSNEVEPGTVTARRIVKSKRVDGTNTPTEEVYAPRWASSWNQAPLHDEDGNSSSYYNDETYANDDSQLSTVDELPLFSDQESQALNREIKALEKKRDNTGKSVQSQILRVKVITDHLHSIRQEIEHTNDLVAAKKGEVDTEEHLSSLSQREFGRYSHDTSCVDEDIATKQKNIARCKNQLIAVEEELEKLKTLLNWNQEELEQWATIATKKEEENLILQKYASVDEIKIKELVLTIEDLTKISVEKKSLLQNEVAETRSNQTELNKLAERFKLRHDERRQLIQQWKDTIESMNSRDEEIGLLASQYAGLSKQQDDSKDIVVQNKIRYEMIENERDEFRQEINRKERLLQTKRQELSALQESEGALKIETDSLQRENSNAIVSVNNKESQRKAVMSVFEQKKGRVEQLEQILETSKLKLFENDTDTRSTEKVTETIEKALMEREEELKAADKNISSLKQKMYHDSLRLAEFRNKEAELISDIHGVHSNIKNFSSKVSELESKRSRQDELLYNANFQLQQIEKKVSKGLGERSHEEQQKLLMRIDELEKEVASEKQKKAQIIQQHRKLQADLRAWNKKYELSDFKYNETLRRIDDINLEIYASEQSLKETISRREDAMVSHDVTLLDVRRLRDTLRSFLEEIIVLKQQRSHSRSLMQDNKDEALRSVEVNKCQLRIRKEECHKSAVDVARRKIALEKVESKYNTIMSIKNAGHDSDDYQSPELKLILASQKRQELQVEGDLLDETIQQKEVEIRTMKKTLVQLQERNTNFRSSFSKADINGAKAKELKSLEGKVVESEESLFRVKKEIQVAQKCVREDSEKLECLTKELAKFEQSKEVLMRTKDQYEKETNEYNATLDSYKRKVSALQESCGQKQSGWELQMKKYVAELFNIQSDRICKLLTNLSKEFEELREDIMVEMKKEGLIEQ